MSHQLALKINHPKIVFILVFDFFLIAQLLKIFCSVFFFFFWKECRESSKIKHFFSKIIAFVNLIGKFQLVTFGRIRCVDSSFEFHLNSSLGKYVLFRFYFLLFMLLYVFIYFAEIIRGSHRGCSVKKVFLKISQKILLRRATLFRSYSDTGVFL